MEDTASVWLTQAHPISMIAIAKLTLMTTSYSYFTIEEFHCILVELSI